MTSRRRLKAQADVQGDAGNLGGRRAESCRQVQVRGKPEREDCLCSTFVSPSTKVQAMALHEVFNRHRQVLALDTALVRAPLATDHLCQRLPDHKEVKSLIFFPCHRATRQRRASSPRCSPRRQVGGRRWYSSVWSLHGPAEMGQERKAGWHHPHQHCRQLADLWFLSVRVAPCLVVNKSSTVTCC